MLRNDYRRALILLRPLVKGLTGHVRLERRTLAGTMRFTVTGMERGATVHALLMADTGESWVVDDLGALRADSRGEMGMIATFDPRNVRGLDLNRYTLVSLVRTDVDSPQLLMTGMVNGSKEIDWGRARAAAAAAFRGDATRAPVAEVPHTQTGECCCDAESAPQAEDAYDEAQAEFAYDEVQAEVEVEPSTKAEPAPAPEAAPPAPAQPETAAQRLGLHTEREWPDEIAALKALFCAAKATDAFGLDDFVFVDAPLPSEDGTEGACAIGLKARDGQPVSVCYALPGTYSVEPPPGLDGYAYMGGWWYTVLEVAPDQALGE